MTVFFGPTRHLPGVAQRSASLSPLFHAVRVDDPRNWQSSIEVKSSHVVAQGPFHVEHWERMRREYGGPICLPVSHRLIRCFTSSQTGPLGGDANEEREMVIY